MANEMIKPSLPVSVWKAIVNSRSWNILPAEEWQKSGSQIETKRESLCPICSLKKKWDFFRETLIHYGAGLAQVTRQLPTAEYSFGKKVSSAKLFTLVMQEP